MCVVFNACDLVVQARLIKLYDDNVKLRKRMENGDDDDDDDDDLQPAWGSPGTARDRRDVKMSHICCVC